MAICATKATYTLKGYFDGNIVIDIVDSSISKATGAYINMNGACLVSEGDAAPLAYKGAKKSLAIITPENVSNQVLALGSSNAIESENNIDLNTSGSLVVYSSEGHGIKAKDMKVYGSGTINVEAEKDGFHGSNFLTNDDEGDASVFLTGEVIIHDLQGEAIEAATSDPMEGTILIDEGASVNVINAPAIAKTDLSLTVNGSLIGTLISGDAVKTDNTGNCVITTTGTFSVNGTAYPNATI